VSCPIVPVGIAGCFAAWSRHRKWPKPSPLFLPPTDSTIAVSVGEPIDPARYARMKRDAMMDDLRDVLKERHAAAERLRRKA
jgi:1-acyl-sn-glycerol-3-phosphate acyltransferase